MTVEEILNATITKTEKMKALFYLGKSRGEVASLLNVGYGFVQNVYSRTYPSRVNRRVIIPEEVLNGYEMSSFSFDRFYGIEIEALGRTVGEIEQLLRELFPRGGWKVKRDSSLQGQNTFEAISPKLKGMSGLNDLSKLLKKFSDLGIGVNHSCGLHVHLDARDFTAKQWLNLVWNYATLEGIIDKFMPSTRRGSRNNYCKTLLENGWKEKLLSFQSEEPEIIIRKICGQIYSDDRYRKMNLKSFAKHGSVEFRQHGGTTNHTKIINWVIFLARLIDFSKEHRVARASWEEIGKFIPIELTAFFQNRELQLA